MSAILEKYVPKEAISLMIKWLNENRIHLRISQSRKTKLGDFRPGLKNKTHRISVNGDLNPFHFLITFTHEVAHAVIWDKYQRKVNPHGQEWKNCYSEMLEIMMQQVNFPHELIEELEIHINAPKASSCSDPRLYKALKKYDKYSKGVFLEDLQEGDLFVLNENRVFKKGKKRRTRYECIDLDKKRLYLVSGHAEVRLVTA
ncbi:MAG: SprT-like domain-containing protein [Flavobacteriales bacterium]|nr:SprT-like domain-containing protein [Flavobacteriales bacterium]